MLDSNPRMPGSATSPRNTCPTDSNSSHHLSHMKKMALSEPSVSWLTYSLSAEKFSTTDGSQTLMCALQWNVPKCVDVCIVGQYQTSRHIFVYGLQTFRSSWAFITDLVQLRNYSDLHTTCISGVPRIFFGGGSTNSVEDRGQRERGSGSGSPLVRGSGGSCNLVQEISFHMVKFS